MLRSPAQTTLLKSLQARLALDDGLGAGFLSVPASALECLDALGAPARPADARPSTSPARPNPASVRPVPSSSPAAPQRPPAPANPVPPPPAARVTLVPYSPPPADPEKDSVMSALRAEAENCAACTLHCARHRVAWGEGNLSARVMFIGDAPGRDEDLEGRPFVGRAGMLLTDIIEKGMKLPRPDVYLTSAVKCRPPGNRPPRAEEFAACLPYAERQFEIIRPEVVVAVGDAAGCALLGLPAGSPGLRGQWHDFRGVALRVIHHPSHLLRQRRSESERTPADREVWADIQAVMKRLGGV